MRFFVVIICIGLAIASGGVGLYTCNKQKEQAENQVETPVEFQSFTVAEMLDDAPVDDTAVELKEFHFAKKVVGFDLDGEKGWEIAFVPLFPFGDQIQTHNYSCVLFGTDEIRSEEDVEEYFERQSVEGYYTYSRELSDLEFNKLAQEYSNFDYSNCVVITTEAPQEDEAVGLYGIGLGCFALFLSLAGWQSFCLIGDMKNKIAKEKSVEPVSDAAGIASIFNESENQSYGSEAESNSAMGTESAGHAPGAIDINSNSGSFLDQFSSDNQG